MVLPKRYDAIVVGGGPSGSTIALMLARAGWRVALVEKTQFPRAKVCGEFISASTFPALAELGLLEDVTSRAGPEIRRVGIFAGETVCTTDMPQVSGRFGKWGRALGREHFDLLMLEAAARAGADVWQPCRVSNIDRIDQGWRCEIRQRDHSTVLSAITVVAANGSWEKCSWCPDRAELRKASDLLAFKAHFDGADLAFDLMPLLIFPGGYGGMVWSDAGRVSLSCCITRRTLEQCRMKGERAADAVLRHLRQSCEGLTNALKGARLRGVWLSAGPIRPGIREAFADGIFRVGNAAGEAHPIIAEEISMAIQSACLLGRKLISEQDSLGNASTHTEIGNAYAASWRANFARRTQAAAIFAHTLQRPRSAAVALALSKHFPGLITFCASLSGKTKQIEIGPPV